MTRDRILAIVAWALFCLTALGWYVDHKLLKVRLEHQWVERVFWKNKFDVLDRLIRK